mgnify:CR=1 FL=1
MQEYIISPKLRTVYSKCYIQKVFNCLFSAKYMRLIGELKDPDMVEINGEKFQVLDIEKVDIMFEAGFIAHTCTACTALEDYILIEGSAENWIKEEFNIVAKKSIS